MPVLRRRADQEIARSDSYLHSVLDEAERSTGIPFRGIGSATEVMQAKLRLRCERPDGQTRVRS